MLGFIGYSSEIGWLSEKLDSEHRRWIRRDWLSGWIQMHGARFDLAGPGGIDARWTPFLQRLIDSESSLHARVALLNQLALVRGIDLRVVDAYFLDIRRNPELIDGDAIIVLSYLHQRGVGIDRTRLQQIVERCAPPVPGGDNILSVLLLGQSSRLPYDAALPWLMTMLDSPIAESHRVLLEASLVQLTFQSGMTDKESWRRWYRSHGGQRREIWIEERLRSIDELIAHDPAQAGQMLLDLVSFGAVHRNMVPYLRKWIEHPALRDETLQCAAMLARERDMHGDAELQEIVRPALADPSTMSPRIKELLRQAGLVPDDEPTWKEIVDYANSRI